MREPAIFWWPGKIKPGVEMGMGSTLDVLPTFCTLAGANIPDDREIDGKDLSGTLFNGKESPRDEMIYYRGQRVYAARKGPYKAHFMTELSYQRDNQFQRHEPPLLYDVEEDPSEKYNIAADYPKALKDIQKMVDRHRRTLGPPTDNLVARIKDGPEVL